MKFSVITNRKTARLNFDFNIIESILGMLIDIRNNSKSGLNLIRNVLKQFLCVLNPYNSSVITYANVDRTALRIGKSAYPFQVFVTP